MKRVAHGEPIFSIVYSSSPYPLTEQFTFDLVHCRLKGIVQHLRIDVERRIHVRVPHQFGENSLRDSAIVSPRGIRPPESEPSSAGKTSRFTRGKDKSAA